MALIAILHQDIQVALLAVLHLDIQVALIAVLHLDTKWHLLTSCMGTAIRGNVKSLDFTVK